MNRRWLPVLLSAAALGLILLYVGQGLSPKNFDYFMFRRLPRITAMILAGAATGIAALAMQAVGRNRILTPAIMGMDSLYILVQTVLVFLGGRWVTVRPGLNALLAITLMWGFTWLLWGYIGNRERYGVVTMVLAGLVAGTLFRSGAGFFQMLADPNEFSILQGFLVASFTAIDSRVVWASVPVFLLAMGWTLWRWKELDILWLGYDGAESLGLDTRRSSRRLFLGAGALTAAATALAGPLTFLGLMLANMAREMAGRHSHRLQAAIAVPLGIIVTVGGQLLIERSGIFKVPLNVVVVIAGGSYLLILILKGGRE